MVIDLAAFVVYFNNVLWKPCTLVNMARMVTIRTVDQRARWTRHLVGLLIMCGTNMTVWIVV